MSELTSVMAVLDHTDPPLRIHYLDSDPECVCAETILFIHGFPQTSHQYRRVVPYLKGYRCIVPDYRGAGLSSHPASDYRKSTMANDLHVLIDRYLGVIQKIWLVGLDIGGMIAHAYATRFPNDVAGIIWGECPLPGTSIYPQVKGTVEKFHFQFHTHTDLAVELVRGNEDAYVRFFLERLVHRAGCFTPSDVAEYVRAYAKPGAMRAACLTYAAFKEDEAENLELLREQGKSKILCFTVNGKWGGHAAFAAVMAEEMYSSVSHYVMPGAGHYLAEERPEEFAQHINARISWGDSWRTFKQ